MRSLFAYITEAKQSALVTEFKRKYYKLYNEISHTFTPKHDTLVISMCGATKYTGRDRIPAREMYVGQANQTLLKSLPDLPVDWIILSGGYGCMNQTSKIHTYTDVIMNLSETELGEIKDYTKYTEDLVRNIQKGHYKEIYVTLSHVWLRLIDWDKIAEATDPSCKIYAFPGDKDKMPDSIIKLSPFSQSAAEKFHADKMSLKEKVISDFLKYKQDHKSAELRKFYTDN